MQRERLDFPMFIMNLARKLKLINELKFKSFSENNIYKEIILRGNTCCGGWEFRSDETVKKYHNIYQRIFDPDIDKRYLFDKYLKRKTSELAIAVHIRQMPNCRLYK